MNLASAITILVTATGIGHSGGKFWLWSDCPNRHFAVGEAEADWTFKAYRSNRVIVWTTNRFRHVKSRGEHQDAYLKLALTKKKGPVRCQVLNAYDETGDHRNHRASVAATVRGTGSGKFRLNVGLSDPYAAAGKYETVVHITVTSP